MARISLLVALALCAVLAAATANPPPRPAGAHPVRAWMHKAGAHLKQFGHREKVKAQAQWQKTVLPKLLQLKKQFGEQWQKKEPLVAAWLKKEAGVYFKKAEAMVNQKLSKGH